MRLRRRVGLGAAGLLLIVAAAALARAKDEEAVARVKVSKAGDIYFDRERISREALVRRLKTLKAKGGHVIYYRESPSSAPSREALSVLEAVAASKIPVQLGSDAPSEWGTLQTFELEVAPRQFRFAISRGQPFLFAFVPPGQTTPQTYYGPLTEEEPWLKRVDLLISADRVIETKPGAPKKAFRPDGMRQPSVHVRVRYNVNTGWQGWYPREHVPPNIESLLSDCAALGLQMLPPPAKRSPDAKAPGSEQPSLPLR
jgi:hypothetical protein